MKKIVCVVGPTASGKTALGIALAKKFNGEVVSADSRMVYRGMEIGTAVPQGEWQVIPPQRDPALAVAGGGLRVLIVENIPHYIVGVVEPNEAFTVVDWRTRAIAAIDDILKRGKLPIVVGGTGLYFSVLLNNFEIPEGEQNISLRKKIEEDWKIGNRKSEIVNQLLRLDPQAAQKVDLKNPRRVARALEVCHATGKPFTAQLKKKAPVFEALQIGLTVQKEELDKRLMDRTQQQLHDGLLEEVKKLKQLYGCDEPAMRGFVYKEMCQYLVGELSLEKAKELIDLRNRQYAKRQMTWFRRDKHIEWVQGYAQAHELVEKFIH